ncbi:MAG: hypothetical protein ACREMM_09090 [Gemmatimonadales bacterium]
MAFHVYAGPWFHSGFGSIGSSGFAKLADLTADRFHELGVALKPGNRLERAREVAVDLHERRLVVAPDDASAVVRASEAVRTIWDFSLVARTAPRAHPPTVEKIQDMLKGALLPADDRNAKGRDTQFELYVAALFAMGRVPIRGEEPDLRFVLDGQECGLAVKRLRSPKKLAARVSDGAAQLQKNGIDGLVVVNVEPFLEGLPSEGTAAELGRRFDERVAPLHGLLPKLAGKERVIGVLGVGTVLEWLFNGPRPRLNLGWFIQFRWFFDIPTEQARIEAFVEGFQARVEGRLAAVFGGEAQA